MRDWMPFVMKGNKGSDMDTTAPRPMLNSPVREGAADAELLVKRVITHLDAAHEANLAAPVVSTWDQKRLALATGEQTDDI